MDLGLKDKVALVTGTGSQIGMGKCISLTLAKEGCDIITTDIDLEGAQKTAEEIKALGHKAIAIKADVANRTEVGEAVKAALAEFGKIDILVNTAGLTAGGGTFLESTKEYWQKDIDVNLYGTMNFCQAVLPGMVERKYGKIINFSSIAARLGHAMSRASSYAAAKGAVLSFTRGLATEFAPSGINVNAIAPGMVATMFGGGPRPGPADPEMEARILANFPLRRRQTVEDMANAVAFLASDVDGGRTMG
jgi:NAD(P)-dependent dehydrogenase (short-subunit alcohol dehydrogenase family)